MKKFLNELLIFLLVIFILTMHPVIAQDKIKMIVKINQEFDSSKNYEEVEFKTIKKTKILDDILIPQRSIIVAEVLQTQKERRWHKSGFMVCRLKYFITDYYEEKVDLSDKNIYVLIRKHEKIDGKKATITGSELVLSSAAAFFAPGVDIAYFFTKGAIQREKSPNWFKAGISNVYDNSIFWFWIKGKPIDLEEQDVVTLKEIDEKRAFTLKSQIEKRKEKKAKREARKEARKAKREAKKLLKKSKKNQSEL